MKIFNSRLEIRESMYCTHLVQRIQTTNFEFRQSEVHRAQGFSIFNLNIYIGIFWCILILMVKVNFYIVKKTLKNLVGQIGCSYELN